MFQLDLTSHKSIYEQVVDKFKELIMTDVLPCDAKLPSVRELSGMLSVNPNTVQKAYRELEREGFCYSVAGRGTFVSDRSRIRPDSRRIEEIKKEIVASVMALRYLGLTAEEAKSIAHSAIDGNISEYELQRKESQI